METVETPPSYIMHNLPTQYDEQGRPIGKSFNMIRDILRDLGFKVQKFTPAWNHHGFKGYDLIEFGVANEDFKQALKLERKSTKRDTRKHNGCQGMMHGYIFGLQRTTTNIFYIGTRWILNKFRLESARQTGTLMLISWMHLEPSKFGWTA
ncbi:Protein INVOLVED IN DE NOVO 2 [Bienertia sinuspersici]